MKIKLIFYKHNHYAHAKKRYFWISRKNSELCSSFHNVGLLKWTSTTEEGSSRCIPEVKAPFNWNVVLICQLAFLRYSFIFMKKVLIKCSDSFPDLSLFFIITFCIWKDTVLNFQLYFRFCCSTWEKETKRDRERKKIKTKPENLSGFRKICPFTVCLALLLKTCVYSEKKWDLRHEKKLHVILNHFNVYYIVFIHSVNIC